MIARSFSAVFLSAVALLLNTGCFSAVKQAYYEVRGAQGEFRVMSERGSLAPYREVEFKPATTTLARLVPNSVLMAYDRNARQAGPRLAGSFPGGSPALAASSEVLYFQKRGLLSGAQLLVRVKLAGETGEVVDGLLVTESKAFREGDEDALASASMEALVRYLLARKPAEETTTTR